LGDGWTIDIICHILKELKGQLDIWEYLGVLESLSYALMLIIGEMQETINLVW
jgi:hypothetical protein